MIIYIQLNSLLPIKNEEQFPFVEVRQDMFDLSDFYLKWAITTIENALSDFSSNGVTENAKISCRNMALCGQTKMILMRC